MTAAAVVLAAGASSRMGEAGPKALALLDGRSLLDHVLGALQAAGVGEVVVVLGPPHEAAIAAALPAEVAIAHNPQPERGMLSSIQAGVARLSPAVDAALVWPVDLPLVAVETVRAILRAAPGRLIIPTHGGRGGHPVRVPRSRFAELGALDPALGLRALVQARPDEVERLAVEDPMILRDVDTPADLRALRDR